MSSDEWDSVTGLFLLATSYSPLPHIPSPGYGFAFRLCYLLENFGYVCYQDIALPAAAC